MTASQVRLTKLMPYRFVLGAAAFFTYVSVGKVGCQASWDDNGYVFIWPPRSGF